MKAFPTVVRVLLYSLVLSVLVSRAASVGLNHDENQFISAGQALVQHGWLPYRDYPYTHMPYGVAFYALSAAISPYDLLAGRILGAVAWLACMILVVAISRLIMTGESSPASPEFSLVSQYGELVLICIFLFHPLSSYVLGAALNHSYATLFSVLALFFCLRGMLGVSSPRISAFLSGACIAIAGLIRFNYASLIVVVVAAWIVYLMLARPDRPARLLLALGGGGLLAALPALALASLAPAAFYYGNIMYIGLNTIYFRGIAYDQDMDLPSKLSSLANGLVHSPIDLVLYAATLAVMVICAIRFLRRRQLATLPVLCAAAFAFVLWLTAFAPTPTQPHYFIAPLPFMLVLLPPLGSEIEHRFRRARLVLFSASLLALIAAGGVVDQLHSYPVLWHPADWVPIQIHDFAENIRQYAPKGRVLTLLPMVTSEAGYDFYPFTVTGPFSWRTSLLLPAASRKAFGVISPTELPALLDASPPAAIVTGFEALNSGFRARQRGGLEAPFVEYARQHGYQPIPLVASFWRPTVTLWVKQP